MDNDMDDVIVRVHVNGYYHRQSKKTYDPTTCACNWKREMSQLTVRLLDVLGARQTKLDDLVGHCYLSRSIVDIIDAQLSKPSILRNDASHFEVDGREVGPSKIPGNGREGLPEVLAGDVHLDCIRE
jgi:hypothetical protein